MGCDIHALIERRVERFKARDDRPASYRWLNSGDPDIGRNYEMYAVLAGVRNSDDIVPIAEPRGLPSFKGWERFSDGERLEQMAERYDSDGHSHSWLTLAEIKAYDTEQEIEDQSYIGGRDETGRVTSTYRWGSAATAETPRVGRRKVLRWPGDNEPKSWLRLIRYMEQAKWDGQTDDEVRLVFFFDN